MQHPDAADPFAFPQTLASLTSVTAVCTALLRWAEPFGLTHYAIGALPHPDQPYPERFIVANWPKDWSETYFTRAFGERDPTLRAAATLGGPFTIADLRKGVIGPLSPGEIEVLDHATSLGFPNGLITPVYRANGYTGLACLVGTGPDPGARDRAILQWLLCHAHDRLRALCAQDTLGAPALSPREVAILTRARQGESDAAIARDLAISVRTVRFHFDNARHKLGARTRPEALAMAVARHLLPA